MSRKTILLSLAIFMAAITPLSAQLTPETAVAEMGRGINLGNTLEPPLEGAWNNGPAEEKYFDAYVAAGFTNVRIPVRWENHTGTEPPYAVDTSWMNRVEEVVDWGLERGLYVTLNGHHEDWLKNDYANPALRARYDSIWVQIVERFQNKSEKLLYEIINEPFGMTVAEVDDLNARILGLIREEEPTRLVIFGGNQYSNSAELLAAAVPDDEYLIGYFHSYDPWPFAGLGGGTWGTESDYRAMDEQFAAVDAWSAANDIPVYVSEFGAVLAADYNSRMRWYAAYVETCLRYGFSFSVWDDGGMFRILDRASNTWPEVKDILVNTYADSPTDLLATPSDPLDTTKLEVQLTWSNRSPDAGIIVERRIAEEPFDTLVELLTGVESYLDTSVSLGNFYTYRLTTRRADGTVLQSYPARVLLVSGFQTPYRDTLTAIPGTLEIENFDVGGEGVAYHDTESENIPGEYRPDEGVDIGGNGRENGFSVGYIAQREWLEYTVDVAQAGAFKVTADVATEIGGGAFQLSAAANDAVVSFSLPSAGTGGWGIYETIEASGVITLLEGEQILRIDITGEQAFNLDNLIFTPAEGGEAAGIVNFKDGLDTTANQFTTESSGITFEVIDGILHIIGDGTSPQYQTVVYTLPDSLLANVAGSRNRLYIGASTASGDAHNLRIDLADENNNNTTLAGRTNSIAGTELTQYLYDYTGGYQDEGYGGTGCPLGNKCAVNGGRIMSLTFYPDPVAGMFNDTIRIDYLSFGLPFDDNGGGGGGEPVGIVNYQDQLTDTTAVIDGSVPGLTYTTENGVLTISGDGTADAYQAARYNVRNAVGAPILADVANSNNLLYISARNVTGDTANLRIDLVDLNGNHTTLAGKRAEIVGDSFSIYTFDYSGAYQDGGYGGTECRAENNPPCDVDSERIGQLVLYLNDDSGMYNGSVEIDWFSFGREISTSVRSFKELEKLSIFPNPATEVVNVNYSLVTAQPVVLELYDGFGRRVRQQEFLGTRGENTVQLTVDDQPTGTYFLRLRIGNEVTRAFAVLVR